MIGHKVLNLEELYNVSCVGSSLGVEVVVDSQLYAELSTAAVKYEASNLVELREANGDVITFNREQIRAILLVKLVQLLKLKKNAAKSSVDFLLALLNDQSVSHSKLN